MYDILQLNDMLVPELQDIALQQNISDPKKLDKQELISKILDKQTVMNNAENNPPGEKPKRKRIINPAVVAEDKDQQQAIADEKPKMEAKAKKAEPVEKKKF